MPHLDGHDLSTRQPEESLLPDISQYKCLFGSLRYFADTTYPSIYFIVGIIGRHLQQPTARHDAAAHGVLRYLRGTHDRGLTFSPEITQNVPLSLQAFCDSDWAQCPDSRRSTTGIVFTFAGGPSPWVSSKQATVAHSSAEAE
jgi:hypothetical protein